MATKTTVDVTRSGSGHAGINRSDAATAAMAPTATALTRVRARLTSESITLSGIGIATCAVEDTITLPGANVRYETARLLPPTPVARQVASFSNGGSEARR